MISVLIVDDHALFRAGLRSRLELEQDITSVGEAATAEEAVSKVRSLQPDLVLLDLLLPGTSGTDAIPKLAEVSPRSRVLVVSSQAAPSSVRQALSAGAAGYVPKRASDQELVAAIRQVAAGERYVDPDLGAKLVVPDRAGARHPPVARARVHQSGDREEALHLGANCGHPSCAHHAEARARDTRRTRAVRPRERPARAQLTG
jgi:DNA-binding NarL/FixJ family response regulator